MTSSISLDLLPPRTPARIVSVQWDHLAPEEAKRLRTLGIEEGAEISIAHRGIFAGRDPLALLVGRMTIAVRRVHARAMSVELVPQELGEGWPEAASTPLAARA